ncbi:MAG: hypothetical protein ACRDAP_10190 [Shewanella sp.]
MESSVVGLSILWGLTSFGIQSDFINSREPINPNWISHSAIEMEGYLIKPLGGDRWLFDTGTLSFAVIMPHDSDFNSGKRLKLSGLARKEPSGWLLNVEHIDNLST